MNRQKTFRQLFLFDLPPTTKRHPRLTGNRRGVRDIWNAFMVKDCSKWENGIPFCATSKIEIPRALITWSEAVEIYNKETRRNPCFKNFAYVCFYEDDYKFDGQKGVWNDSDKALKILCHFAGIITPDFSTCEDFPPALKAWNTYRMRAFGCWCSQNGVNVINNVRWSADTAGFCFSGIPKRSVVCLGTAASGIYRRRERWAEFARGLSAMADALKPEIALVYGSANYPFFKALEARGVSVKSYSSRRSRRKL